MNERSEGMSESDEDRRTELEQLAAAELGDQMMTARNPAVVSAVMPFLRLAMKGYFRSEVRDIDKVPEGGALVVSNHSGGLTPMDLPIFLVDFVRVHGADRPVFCLAHDAFISLFGAVLKPFGMVAASRENAHAILSAGAVTIVFPGGDYDTLRPSSQANVIDFNGRTGYLRTALRAGVPIVPMVSIGGQEGQLHLSRGEWIAKRLPTRNLIRSDYFPISIGFPFGLTPAIPVNLPLPTKITSRVLDPIDIEAEFGPDPDIAEVDREVRARMQEALDELARERKFPVLG